MVELSLIALFQEPNFLWVILGVCMLAIATSCVGTFAWLNKQSLIGDAMAHCALPGVAIAFLFSQSRHPFILLPAAIIAALTGNAILNWLVRRTKLSPDSALAIVLSGYFAIGAMILSLIQKMPIAGKAGINQMLFGQAAALDSLDVNVLTITACVVIFIVMMVLPRLRMVIFDSQFAQTTGTSVAVYKQLMGVLIVVCVVIGIQIVGVVLMSSLLIFPAINARQWSNHLHRLLVISAITALLASVLGVLISYYFSNMPTGPWIVVFLTIFLLFSLLFSPRSGGLVKRIIDYRQQTIIHSENITRIWYLLHHKTDNKNTAEFTKTDALKVRSMKSQTFNRGFKYALKKGWLEPWGYGYRLSTLGFSKAEKITRHHRLWEKYLSENKQLPAQQVHNAAEYAEHIIDDNIADKLDEILGHPSLDPHGQFIPIKKDSSQG